MIIGITGTNGAGKGAVVDYLVKTKGFTHFSCSGYIARELAQRGIASDRSAMRMMGNELRATHGAGYLVEVALAERSEGAHMVIESIRSSEEAAALRRAGGALLLVDADRSVRYERIISRGSSKDVVDFNTFVEQEEREWHGAEGAHDMDIKVVMDTADFRIYNNGTFDALGAQIDDVLARIIANERH